MRGNGAVRTREGKLENTARSLLYNSHCSTPRQWPPQTMAGTSYLAETICGKPGIWGQFRRENGLEGPLLTMALLNPQLARARQEQQLDVLFGFSFVWFQIVSARSMLEEKTDWKQVFSCFQRGFVGSGRQRGIWGKLFKTLLLSLYLAPVPLFTLQAQP